MSAPRQTTPDAVCLALERVASTSTCAGLLRRATRRAPSGTCRWRWRAARPWPSWASRAAARRRSAAPSLRLVPIAAGRVTLRGHGLGAARRRRPAWPSGGAPRPSSRTRTRSLSPYMRVLDLVAEPLVVHGARVAQRARGAGHRGPRAGAAAPAAELVEPLPAHALGRPAAAGQHRAGHGLGARLPRGRRAGVHDRRLQPGRDPGPAARPPGARAA